MADAKLNKVYKEIDQKAKDNDTYYCFLCGSIGSIPLGHHHILPTGQFPEQKYNPDNIILVGHYFTCKCHFIIHNQPDKIMKIPYIAGMLEKMRNLSEFYYNRFIDKN